MQTSIFMFRELSSRLIQKFGYMLVAILMLAVPVHIRATDLSSTTGSVHQQISITGTITDEQGEPLPGVNVVVQGTILGVVSNVNGVFTIPVSSEDAVLVFSFVGFATQEITVGSQRNLNVVMAEDAAQIGEVVVVGYGTQRKETITGSVVSVSAQELVVTKSPNVQNMLTGKLPGVRNIQKTSEPGVFNNQFDIRGMGEPLLVVDGVPRGDLARMDPNDIESISVLKDASAAIYGMRGGNGVILITTKSGEKGRAKIEYSGYYGIQVPAEILQPLNTGERGTLFSERSMRNNRSTPTRGKYDDAWFESYENGELTDTDWYAAIMRKTAPQQQHNVSVSGGSEKIDYFVNLGYTNQESFWKTNASNYDRFNLRTNLNAQITDNLKAGVRLNMIMDKTNRQRASTTEIFKALWRHVPEDPLYANDNELYLQNSSVGLDWGNVLAIVDPDISGFVNNKRNILQSNLSLEYAAPFIKGLKAAFLYSYDMSFNDNTEYEKQYSTYTFNVANETYVRAGAYPSRKTNLNRYYSNSSTSLWNIRLNYDNTFLSVHRVNALLLYEERYSQGYNFRAYRQFDIEMPYLFAGNAANQEGSGSGLDENANRSLVGRLNYEYGGKYLTEFSFRYDGSSRFPTGKQWGFFPSILLGYRISEESFIKDNLTFVSNLKIRGTWGQLGDDSTGQYQFVEGYGYPISSGSTGSANRQSVGYIFGNALVNGLDFRNAPNPNITWMKTTMKNIGVDADFYGNLIGFSLDLFQRDRTDILASPGAAIQTFGSGFAQANLNADRTKGLEIELRHRHKYNDFRYYLTGYLQMTRTMVTKRSQTERNNSYDYWRNNTVNRWNDIWFGRGDGGIYNSWDEIANDPNATVSTLPGDFIYEDWNGDGIINDDDVYPIATMTSNDNSRLPNNNTQDGRNYPLMNFGFTLSGDWKGIDVNVMFQGAALTWVGYGEQILEAMSWDGNGLQLHMDRWHPEDPNANPWDPNTVWVPGYYSYGNLRPQANSEVNMQKGNYLRLKSAEIGYTIPKNLVFDRIGIKNMRIYVNAYNLLTITKVRGVDPEKPSESNGYMYPLNRTFNFGGSITF